MILYRAIGIDPGISGAVCWIDFPAQGKSRRPRVGRIYDAPLFDSDRKAEFDFHSAVGILQQALQPETEDEIPWVRAIVETASARPGQGIVSTSRYVGTYWAWLGILAALKISHQTVAPNTWKKEMKLSDDKELSRRTALRLYPEAAEWLTRKGDHNRAEALLLADYFRRLVEQGKS